MTGAALLRVENLSVRYGREFALRDASLALGRGERLGLIGESGSGKTTLARAVADLLPPGAERRGLIDWHALGRPARLGRDIGFVFQDAAASLDPVLTVGEQVAEAARAALDLPWREAYGRAAELFGRVRLPDPASLLRAFPHQLSGGQKQRVGIAAAIAGRPALLIADEPTSALDTIVQAEIARLLAGLVRDDGMSLILVTHDIALASGLCDRLAVMHGGRLVEQGLTGRVVAMPEHAHTRLLLATHLGLDDVAPAAAR